MKVAKAGARLPVGFSGTDAATEAEAATATEAEAATATEAEAATATDAEAATATDAGSDSDRANHRDETNRRDQAQQARIRIDRAKRQQPSPNHKDAHQHRAIAERDVS